MNDPDQTITFSSIKNGDGSYILRKSDGLDDAWTSDDFTADEDNPTVDRAAAFVSLAFIAAALKRSAWVWCATAVLGLLLGYAIYTKFPPAYSATTSVLVANNPNADSTQASATNVALATSQAVAGKAIQQLGLHQSVSSFIAAYTVTASSNQVLVFQVSAPSSSAALQRAQALATSFLQFRASYLENQQQLQVSLAQQQVTKAQQKVTSVNHQISALSGQGATPSEQARLSDLQAQLTTAESALTAAQQNASAAVNTGSSVTDAMVKGSQILNSPTPVPHTFKASKLFYMVLALIAGLAIGMAIIVVRALVSDRLRNRDDIAEAIGAPIKLSTGQVGTRLLPPLGRRSGRRGLDMERLVAHLDGAVAPSPAKRCATLAVVDVDNAPDVVPAVVSLAVSWASQGKQVVLADLSHSAAAGDGLAGARLVSVVLLKADKADESLGVLAAAQQSAASRTL